jgi:DNA-binding MarR family transcriptional regulator
MRIIAGGTLKTASKPEDRDDPQQGLELFLELCRIWDAAVPKPLRGEDPSLLSRFLELSDSDNGVAQADLRKELKVSQPQISRLALRLKKAGLVTDNIPVADGRVRLTKLTPTGKELLHKLWLDLKYKRQLFRSTAEKLQDDADNRGW